MTELNLDNRHSVTYGKQNISFCLLYCERKTIEIAVHPDSSVIVKAPFYSDITLIEKKITKRARWIIRQKNYFNQFHPKTPLRYYVNGETHLYLGKQYRLRITEGSENSVKLLRGFLHITSRNKSTPETAKHLLYQWYRERAQIQFAESMDRCWPKFNESDILRPKLTIRRMEKRWGSFSKKGTVILNTELIKAPKECIDYVVSHELCHLKHKNHNKEFYTLLDKVMPEWEKAKHQLEVKLA